MKNNYRFKHGQTVWVKHLQDILESLDADNSSGGLLFMPEMIPYCGKSFKVSRLASKTCVEGHGLRHMEGTVFLEDLRCNGSLHDGCQRECRLFWKEAWLTDKPLTKSTDLNDKSISVARTRLKTTKGDGFICQSTSLANATSDLPKGKIFQYISDVWIGEMTVSQIVKLAINSIINRLGCLIGLDTCNEVQGHGKKTESVNLNLKPGEWVEIKSREEIKSTLNVEGLNRGLLFEHSMLDYCGKQYRVAKRLEKIIIEESGRMVPIRNTVILEGVTCQTACPRANLIYWRDIWLKRVDPPKDNLTRWNVMPETGEKPKKSEMSVDM